MRKIIKKILLFTYAMILGGISCSPISAASTNNLNTKVNGTIAATILKVSVPSSLAFSIDPNRADSFVSSEIEIVNQTNAPIKVSLASGEDQFKQAADSSWKPIDYLPNELKWEELGEKETEESLALGVKVTSKEDWKTVVRDTPLWVKEHKNSGQSVTFGEVTSNSSVKMGLDVKHGSTFREAKNCSYQITWSFSLTD